jgi:PAS domain S-box-containing protein
VSDFHGLFEASPGLFMVLAPDAPRYTIIAVSDEYARAASATRDEVVGRGVFEILTDGPADAGAEDPHHLRASLEAVVRRRTIDATPPRKLVVARSPPGSAGLDRRSWRLVNAPVFGRDGDLRCIIHHAEDVTELVRREKAEQAARRAEERWAFQLELGDALRVLATPLEVQATACRMLGQHLRVNRVHFAEIDGDEFVVRAGYVDGLAPFQARGPIALFGEAVLAACRRGEAVIVDDVDRDSRFTPAERARLHAAGTAAFAGAVLMRGGRWVASLGMHSATARAWTPDDVATLKDVADRIWTAAERAHAETALRESEARYSAIFEKSPVGKALTRWSDRVIVSANQEFLRILEFTADEVIGKTTVDLGISTREAQEQLRALLESRGSVREFECTRIAKSGTSRILSVNLDWVQVQGEKHILTTIGDLTDLRRAEKVARAHERERLVEQVRGEALRRSEAKYSGILQTSADAIVSIDEQQRITLFNGTAERMFGYTRAEVMGAPLELLVPGRLRAAHRAHVARFAAGDQMTHVMSGRSASLLGLRKGGGEFPLEATISKVTVDGETTITAAIRDRTATVRAEIEQRLLSEVGRTLASPIDEEVALVTLTRLAVNELADLATLYLVGDDGSVQRRGAACRDPAQQRLTELLMNLPVDGRNAHPLWQILDTRRPLLMEIAPDDLPSYALSEEHRLALETFRPRSVVGVPIIVGGRVAGALFVASCRPARSFDARDVVLVEEIARRTALSLDNARLYRAAREAIRARDEVLGIVAHDLRGPLGVIHLSASLHRAPDGQPERRSLRTIDAIERSAGQMNRMINDLLDVTRMEAGHLDLDRGNVTPGELLAEVVEEHRERAAAQSIAIRCDAPPRLPAAWADRGRIIQVFENLIGNAIRVTTGGSIVLAARPGDGEISFTVTDTGSGIAPEDLPHVFDRFWQARTKRRGGAGLGLSIVKAIVEGHGGRVWIESKPGAGTSVFFTVPTAQRPSSASITPV